MTLIRTTLLSALSTFIRMCSAFVANKVLAVYIGPAGVALLGQFQNLFTIVTTFGGGASSQGVTKYIAEYSGRPKDQSKILTSSLQISFFASITFGLLMICFGQPLSAYVFHNQSYANVIRTLGLSLTFISANTNLLAALNGLKEIKRLITVGIVTNLIGLSLTIVMCVLWRAQGAMVSMVISQGVVLILTWLLFPKKTISLVSCIRLHIDWLSILSLLKFALMALVTSLVFPLAQVIIRNYIIVHLSLNDAGYWQGVWKISDVYLTLVTMSLATYYLPRVSEIADDAVLKAEILRVSKLLIPITLVSAALIFTCRGVIISLLFTPSFIPMKQLFLFQLIGDFIKISSWVLSFLMVARAMTIHYVVSEILFSVSFVILSILSMHWFGLVGVTYAFAADYLLYFIAMIIIFRKVLFTRPNF